MRNNKLPPNVTVLPRRATHHDDWWIVHAPLVIFKIKHGINKKGS